MCFSPSIEFMSSESGQKNIYARQHHLSCYINNGHPPFFVIFIVGSENECSHSRMRRDAPKPVPSTDMDIVQGISMQLSNAQRRRVGHFPIIVQAAILEDTIAPPPRPRASPALLRQVTMAIGLLDR